MSAATTAAPAARPRSGAAQARPSRAAVAANRTALLGAMKERSQRGGAKLRPSYDAIVQREIILSDAGRSAQGDSPALRAHAEMASMGRMRHRAGRSRGARATTPKKDRKKRRKKGATVIVPWELRDQLDKSSEIVAAQEAPGLGDKSRILVKGRLRSDGREWWAPQVDPDDTPHSDALSTERPMVFGFHDFEQRGREAIDEATEFSRSCRYPGSPGSPGASSLQADSATWSVEVMQRLGPAPTTTLERMAATFDDMRPGPRLGNLKARASGNQVRAVPTATELFEVLDAEARIAGADDETNHWQQLDELPLATAGSHDRGYDAFGAGGSDEDDDPLPSLDGVEDDADHGDDDACAEPEPEPEPEPVPAPEDADADENRSRKQNQDEDGDGGLNGAAKEAAAAREDGVRVAASGDHRDGHGEESSIPSMEPQLELELPLAPFSDDDDVDDVDDGDGDDAPQQGQQAPGGSVPAEISIDSASISPVVDLGHRWDDTHHHQHQQQQHEAAAEEDEEEYLSITSSLPDLSTVGGGSISDGGDHRGDEEGHRSSRSFLLGDDHHHGAVGGGTSRGRAVAAEPYLQQLIAGKVEPDSEGASSDIMAASRGNGNGNGRTGGGGGAAAAAVAASETVDLRHGGRNAQHQHQHQHHAAAEETMVSVVSGGGGGGATINHANKNANENANGMGRSRSSVGEHLSRVRRTSEHFQAISRLSSHTAASAAKRALKNGGGRVEDGGSNGREEYFADRSGRPDLFAEARQEYFSLVKEKQALAQAEGYDAPSVDSPRNAFVENLIPPRGEAPSSRAGRAAQAAREQRLAHTAALESGESGFGLGDGQGQGDAAGLMSTAGGGGGEDLILSMLGPSVVDVMPELRAHQLQVAPMPLLIGRDFPRNHTVALAHYRLGDTLGTAFGSGLARLASQVTIQKLLLSQCTLGPVGTSAIAAAVSHCDSLTHLDLGNNPIGDKGAEALAAVLEEDRHRTLYTLVLSKCSLTDEGASRIIRSVHKNGTLRSLDLAHNGIGRGSHTHLALAQLLTRNEALSTLLLGWNSIHGVRAEEFLNALRYNTNIQHLDLSWNTVGSRGACCLGWSLRFNTALLSLDLTHNDIGERGAFVLADTLQENNTLESLTLDKNPLGQIGGAALLRALRAYEAMGVDRLIEIQQCNFDAKEYPAHEEEQQQRAPQQKEEEEEDPSRRCRLGTAMSTANALLIRWSRRVCGSAS